VLDEDLRRQHGLEPIIPPPGLPSVALRRVIGILSLVRVRWINIGGAIAVGVMLMHNTGCTRPSWLMPAARAPSGQATAAAGASGLTMTALPMYRLVTSPELADSPSRLFVIQVRLVATDAALSVSLDDMTLVLPNGQHGRTFDRARALELLRRTTLVDADLSYLLHNGDHVPGGLSDAARASLRDLVAEHLLTDDAFTAEQPLVGFVIVDTGVTLLSLDGASLEVVAHRLRDAEPAATVYAFTGTPTAVPEAP
jgi:hypothetical protein